MFWPCDTRTSTCRNFATISSGLYRFLAITVLLDVKDIPQVGPLQWGRISGQPQQNSQSGPLEQPQATTPHEERARTDEMGLANLALRIKYRGERTRMIPMGRKSPVDTHIGQRLKEYRQLRGMTVRELADAAHVTPGQNKDYPHGPQEPRRHTHRTTLKGIPPASRDDSTRACRRRPRNAGANQPL